MDHTDDDLIRGLALRYLLTLTLFDEGGPLTVAELVLRVEEAGFSLGGRPSKVISDALRWEIDKGRVVRVRRATYESRPFPRQTRYWMRKRIERIHRFRAERAQQTPIAARASWSDQAAS